MYVHGGEDVGVDLAAVFSRVFVAGVDGVRVPVRPEERVLVQRQRERVRQRALHHHLPENTHTHA